MEWMYAGEGGFLLASLLRKGAFPVEVRFRTIKR